MFITVQLILDKIVKNMHWRKDRLFNSCCWGTRDPMKIEVWPLFLILYKNKLKTVQRRNVRHKTLKLLEKKSEEMPRDIDKGNNSLDKHQKAQKTKAKEAYRITS